METVRGAVEFKAGDYLVVGGIPLNNADALELSYEDKIA